MTGNPHGSGEPQNPGTTGETTHLKPAGQITRREAVVAGFMGDETKARTARTDSDPRVRASAYGALARIGALNDDELTEALRDPSTTVRMRAAALTVSHPGVSPAPLLDDARDEVVEVAAWACGEQGATELVGRLAELTTDHSNPLVRESAVAALGALGHPDGLAAILAATTDRAPIRRRAVLALAPFDGPDVDAALTAAADDRDWQVRDAAELLWEPPG